jgi:glucokinase
MYVIGIDIGGMSVKVGLVDENGKIIAKNRRVTEKKFSDAVKLMIEQIENLLAQNNVSENEIKGIGIGVPGFTNYKTLTIEQLTNLEWDNAPIGEILKNRFNVEVSLSNDANVAVLGEVRYGVAKGYQNCVMFTLGTGVGGGAIVNGKLMEGFESKGAEFGHATLIMGGLPCGCGRRGCVEQYVSATAIIRQTKNAMLEDKDSSMWRFVDGNLDNVDGRTAFECAKLGDKTANKVVDKYIEYLGESVLSVLNVFRPEIFLLGGGLSAQGDYLIDKLREYCERYDYGYKGAPKTEFKVAVLGNDAGIIGAASLI